MIRRAQLQSEVISQPGSNIGELLLRREESMADENFKIDFEAPASLRKWPSLNSERLTGSRHLDAYLLVDSTLDECIKEFMAKPVPQRHLYEIHTAPQQPLVSAVLSAEHIIELARLRDFL